MMSRRQAILSLSMVALMLALPWTAVADSSGRGSEEESEKIKITTHKQVSENRIAIEIEANNNTLTTIMYIIAKDIFIPVLFSSTV